MLTVILRQLSILQNTYNYGTICADHISYIHPIMRHVSRQFCDKFWDHL